jgi:hypothetical protein
MAIKRGKIVAFCVAVVFFAALAVAAPILTPQFFSANDSTSSFFNITVNNSEAGSTNISQVNITLPSGFSYISSTAGTTASTATFSNISQTLTWNLTDNLVANVTNQSFWFNATANASTVGTFNFTVSLLNNTGVHYYNITINISDISIPYKTSFVVPSPPNSTTYSNSNSSSITINISALDHVNLSNVTIQLYNVTRHLINSTFLATGPYNSTYVSLAEGNYSVNATAIDLSSNKNYTETRQVILDRTDPSISSITKVSSTTSRITVNYTCSDSGSGVKSCSVTSSSDGSVSSNTITSLDCGVDDVTVTVTAQDYANNTKTRTSSAFANDACDGSSDDSSGGGSDSTDSNTTWTATYTVKDSDFKAGYSKELAEKTRIKFNVNSEQHTLGIIDLTSTRATINVSSTPQQATLSKGDSKKFDVDDDNFYDLIVTLNSINNSKANITILAISEEMEAKKITSSALSGNSTTAAKKIANSTTTNSSAKNSSIIKNVFSGFSGSYYKIGIIGIVIGLLIVLYIIGREKRWFDHIPLFYKTHTPTN